MFANYPIGLREGPEAALAVAISLGLGAALTSRTTNFEGLAWLLYLVPTMTAFLISVRRRAAAAPTRPAAPPRLS